MLKFNFKLSLGFDDIKYIISKIFKIIIRRIVSSRYDDDML